MQVFKWVSILGLSVPSALVWSVIPHAPLHRDSVDSFLPTPALEDLVPVPEFPLPMKAVRGLPSFCTPWTFGKQSMA